LLLLQVVAFADDRFSIVRIAASISSR
jgi:aerobic carbon-monoxide dehydrogenase large subunit